MEHDHVEWKGGRGRYREREKVNEEGGRSKLHKLKLNTDYGRIIYKYVIERMWRNRKGSSCECDKASWGWMDGREGCGNLYCVD